MRKRIYFNAFHMNCVVHQSPGLWVRPEDRMTQYTDLNTWVELARLLERGRFDALFLADVIGPYDVYRGNAEAALRQAAQMPVNDPMLLIPAMAQATEHLGFAFTSSTLQYHPFIFARLISTLDHLTKGRIAWNIVTSYLDSAARSLGQSELLPHDERYDVAEEYVEVCYKLWEGSWRDDAVVKDRARGIYADPARVRAIHHEGRYFRSDGYHLAEPSPQRTPVLFQAGASPRGREFAARHAECVFVSGLNPAKVGELIRQTRLQAGRLGRDPADLLFFLYAKVITADSEAAVQRKYRDYLESVRDEGALALLSGWAGIDFSKYADDELLQFVETNAVRTLTQSFKRPASAHRWTLGELVKLVGLSGGGPLLMGTPEQLADTFENWIAAGVDGFNLAYMVTPGSFADFVEGVAPVLQRRGLMQTEYQDGTLREKLMGAGRARLRPPHPAVQHRWT
ncbi:MAG TPA: LLM class flavin-dependent oxidoreductase [Candidatus Binataceae bacterium]|jgi:FMN-dependent oxidoreductase (nitrilotriacetate monooxygenase family)|nr:LLM class flavin-dependent oxidoreductase [Candidatus Binataceae bacterium]